MSAPKPIKRDKNLTWLSRDHHDGLLIVWKIRQGLKQNISATRIVDFVVNAFDNDLQPHFVEEEDLLFIKLLQNDPLRIEAEGQHAAIREKVAALKQVSGNADQTLQLFANLLEAHIRFEERTLFPHLEKEISKEELAAIGIKLETDHQKKKAFTWHDEFWVKQ